VAGSSLLDAVAELIGSLLMGVVAGDELAVDGVLIIVVGEGNAGWVGIVTGGIEAPPPPPPPPLPPIGLTGPGAAGVESGVGVGVALVGGMLSPAPAVSELLGAADTPGVVELSSVDCFEPQPDASARAVSELRKVPRVRMGKCRMTVYSPESSDLDRPNVSRAHTNRALRLWP
jgi:hypothetical protein